MDRSSSWGSQATDRPGGRVVAPPGFVHVRLRDGRTCGNEIAFRAKRHELINRGDRLAGFGGVRERFEIRKSSRTDALPPRCVLGPPIQSADLDRTLDLAGRRDVPVLWYLTVIHPEVQRRAGPSGLDAGSTRFVAGVRARHPGVTLIDARKADHAADLFSDGATSTGGVPSS